MKQYTILLAAFLPFLLTSQLLQAQTISEIKMDLDTAQQVLQFKLNSRSLEAGKIEILDSEGYTCGVERFDPANHLNAKIFYQGLTDGTYQIVMRTKTLTVKRNFYIHKGQPRLGREVLFSGKQSLSK